MVIQMSGKIDSVYDLEITDCHHHLWDLQANYYPWLTDTVKKRVCGDYEKIRNRNFLLKDFRQNRGALKVDRMVHVEAVIDRSDPVQETAWLQSIANEETSEGFPQGIVAHAGMERENIESVLEGHCEHPNIRGIRDFVHEAWIDPENPQTSQLENAIWRDNIGLLKKHGLSFDLQVYWQQMKEAAALVESHPDQPFVLVHIGQPAYQDEENSEGWRNGMKLLSQQPNLVVKLSGFGMFDRNWTVDSIRPWIHDTIEWFGVDRCLFASNFPVDGLARGYQEYWESYYEVVKDFSDDEKRMLFDTNARRVYGV